MPVEAQEHGWVLANWLGSAKAHPLRELLATCGHADVISLALGLPSAELLPQADFGRATTRVLAEDPQALQLTSPSQALKQQILPLMALRGVSCRPSQVFLTSGAQQGLDLVSRLLLDEPGRTVMVDELTYPGLLSAVAPFRPRIVRVPVIQGQGVDLEAMERLLRGGERPAFIYSMPEAHNPMGTRLSPEARARLVDIARSYRVPVVEDDPYGLLDHGSSSPPAMRSLDEQWVIYVGTFSKLLGPGLRAGWMVVPEGLQPSLSLLKDLIDTDSCTFVQRCITRYLEDGHLSEHLARLRQLYGERRERMLAALKQHFPAEVQWNEPQSGFFLWVRLPEGMNAVHLLRTAVETERVAFVPGVAFGTSAEASRSLRLSFARCRLDEIDEGIRRLGRLLHSSLTHK